MANQVRDLGELSIAKIQEDEDVLVASFADQDSPPTTYVILSKMAAPSAEDVELGEDIPHIEIDGQENSQYDAGLQISVKEKKIQVMFSPGSNLHSICPGIDFECQAADVDKVLAFIEKRIGIPVSRS